MISLYTLQRFVHFSPQDSIASAWFSHCMMFEKRMTETQSFRNNHSLLWMDRYTYFPLHLLVHLFKRSCNLLSYARAHNSLRLHTEVSSMNNLMIPLSLGGGPYTNRQHWVLQVPQSTQMWVLVATLIWTINKHLTSVMNITQTQIHIYEHSMAIIKAT